MNTLPNLITFLRILLVLPLAGLLLNKHYSAGLLIALIAGITDALDGYLAKRFGWTSRMGSILDPLADKLLLVCGLSILTFHQLLPSWLLWLVIARDLIIIVGAFIYNQFICKLNGEPSWISKANTVLQIALLLTILFDQASIFSPLPSYVITTLIYMVAFTTLVSGVHYVLVWGIKAYGEINHSKT